METTNDLGKNWRVLDSVLPVVVWESQEVEESEIFGFGRLVDIGSIPGSGNQILTDFAQAILTKIFYRDIHEKDINCFLEAVKDYEKVNDSKYFESDLSSNLFTLKCIAYFEPELKHDFLSHGEDFFKDVEALINQIPQNIKGLVVSSYNNLKTANREENAGYYNYPEVSTAVDSSTENNSQDVVRQRWDNWCGELDQKFSHLESITDGVSIIVKDLEYLALNDDRLSNQAPSVSQGFGIALKAIVLNHFAQLNDRPDLKIGLKTLGQYHRSLTQLLGASSLPQIIQELSGNPGESESELVSMLQNLNLDKPALKLRLEAENEALVGFNKVLESKINLLEGQVDSLKSLVSDLILVIKADPKFKNTSEFAKENLECILQWQVLGQIYPPTKPIPLILESYFTEVCSTFGNTPNQILVSAEGQPSVEVGKIKGRLLTLVKSQRAVNRDAPLQFLLQKRQINTVVAVLEQETIQRERALVEVRNKFIKEKIAIAEDELIELVYLKTLSWLYMRSNLNVNRNISFTLNKFVEAIFTFQAYQDSVNAILAKAEESISLVRDSDEIIHSLKSDLEIRLNELANEKGEKGLKSIFTTKLKKITPEQMEKLFAMWFSNTPDESKNTLQENREVFIKSFNRKITNFKNFISLF